MRVKVLYDGVTKDILGVYPIEDASPPPFVVCERNLLEGGVIEFVDPMDPSITITQTRGLSFPTDLMKLKTIAVQTIDHWRQSHQGSGYTHTATGVTYGSDDRTRSLLVGKIQEMQVLPTASGIFPNIQGVPVTHTLTEIEAVGVGMAAKVEADYLQAVSLTQQVLDPAVTDLAGIEAILAPVLGAA